MSILINKGKGEKRVEDAINSKMEKRRRGPGKPLQFKIRASKMEIDYAYLTPYFEIDKIISFVENVFYYI